jgi:molybdopterin converting factor small subunit
MSPDPTTIDLRLFASLAARMPPDAARFSIPPGITVRQLIGQLGIASTDAKLIFVNGVRKDLETPLTGGERVGIFPPVGGG